LGTLQAVRCVAGAVALEPDNEVSASVEHLLVAARASGGAVVAASGSGLAVARWAVGSAVVPVRGVGLDLEERDPVTRMRASGMG
jgi:hypothetical protein